MVDGEIAQEQLFYVYSWHGFQPFNKSIGKEFSVAWSIGSGDKDSDGHGEYGSSSGKTISTCSVLLNHCLTCIEGR